MLGNFMKKLEKSLVLSKEGIATWEKLKQLRGNFILGGGTGLALQLGHRRSIDFDFFSYKKISNSLLNQCKKIFGFTKVLINNQDELTFLTKENVKITFIYYPYKFAHKIKMFEGIKVLNIIDIASAKAYTLNRRASLKDYIDIYYILNNNILLSEIIKNAQLTYKEVFSEKLFLAQLIYFDDIKKEDWLNIVLLTNEKLNNNKLEKYFKEKIKF